MRGGQCQNGSKSYMTLITGASRGIGGAIAHRLALDGHTVVNLSRSAPDKDFPGVSYSVDLKDFDALKTALKRLTDEHSIDNLVNNAAPRTGQLWIKSKWLSLIAWWMSICVRQLSSLKHLSLRCAQRDAVELLILAAVPRSARRASLSMAPSREHLPQ